MGMIMGVERVGLIFNTLRFLNRRQAVCRVRYEFVKRFRRRVAYRSCEGVMKQYSYEIMYQEPESIEFLRANYSETNLAAQEILINKFRFLNTYSYTFNNSIDWTIDPFKYRLWNFNLNYFDYLEDLMDEYARSDSKAYLIKGIELISSWIEDNLREYNYNLWDSYVTSKRLINWINFIALCKKCIEIPCCDLINDAIAIQAYFLYSSVEYHLDANHLIMDGKGLIFSGVYLEIEGIRKRGIAILIKEYERQVMGDGGHYERSSSYHVEVLSHYLESYLVLSRNGFNSEAEGLYGFIEKMADYLEDILMPNGEIPLVNDSSLDYPFRALDLLEACSLTLHKDMMLTRKPLSRYAFRLFGIKGNEEVKNLSGSGNNIYGNNFLEDTGYYIIRDYLNNEELYLLFDCGDNGPEYNLGHTHADNLNIIFTLGMHKIFTDSGTFTYKAGQDRDMYRATAAHNTICIDKTSSSQVWGAFRTGKRAYTRLGACLETDTYVYISAFHDGYTRALPGDSIFHKREVLYLKGLGIIIIDTLFGIIRNEHNAEINFHLGRGTSISDDDDDDDDDDMEIATLKNRIKIKASMPFSIKNSYISEGFSIKDFTQRINAGWGFSERSTFVTQIIFNDNLFRLSLNDGIIEIMYGSKGFIQIKRR